MQEYCRASRLRVFSVVLAVAVAASPAVAAEIELTRLNACPDIASVLERLQGSRRSSDDDCRPASNAVERGIRSAFSQSGQDVCILRRAPVSSLADFGCMRTSVKGHETMTCIRAASANLVAEYKAGYVTTYAIAISRYLAQAAQCPGSNGDAAIAPSTTFSPFLISVAAFQLGFVSQYGSTRPGNAFVSHGFAKTSPDVSRAGIEAIEYVVFNSAPDNGASIAATDYTNVGNWRLRLPL